MGEEYQEIYDKLHKSYEKYRKKYKHNPDSKQMCCMWSTNNPPDILEGTPPFYAIEKAFDIELDEDLAIELYDMKLEKASLKIAEILKQK